MTSNQKKKQTLPAQHQNHQPGVETERNPQPQFECRSYAAAGKLKNKVALITGEDSSIGRAVALAFAKEGADIAIVYLNEHEDAEEAKRHVEQRTPLRAYRRRHRRGIVLQACGGTDRKGVR